MKAKELIEILQGNPEAEVFMDCAPNWHPVEAGIYPWGSDLFVMVEQDRLDRAQQDAQEVMAFQDFAEKDEPFWVEDAHAYFPAPERDDC